MYLVGAEVLINSLMYCMLGRPTPTMFRCCPAGVGAPDGLDLHKAGLDLLPWPFPEIIVSSILNNVRPVLTVWFPPSNLFYQVPLEAGL